MHCFKPFCLFLLLAALLTLQPAVANYTKPDQARLQQLDHFAFNTNARYATNVATLAAYLSKGATTDYEKARIIYAWVAKNIRYDDYAYNAGKGSFSDPESVLKNRRSVCDGYALLYKALGKAMGLEVEKVSGYAKGFGFAPGYRFTRTNHAWNAVKLDGKWILLDPTWAAGSGQAVNGKLKTIYQYDPYWFDVDPHAFLFSHLPVKPEYQSIATPLTLAQYEQLADVDASLFRLGANSADVLDKQLKGKMSNLPKSWKTDLDIQIKDVPLEARLAAGKTYTLEFTVADDVEMVVKNGKDWHHFKTTGKTQTLQLKPLSGDLAIMARKKGSKVNFSYFLEYEVRR